MQALSLYYNSDESREGVTALRERRTPDFRKVLGLKSYVNDNKS